MKNTKKHFKYYCVIFLILVVGNPKTKLQNVIFNNHVISYCYQPIQPSPGLTEIYAINTDGTNNRKISNASIGISHQDWSPDTMKFAAVGYIDGGYTTWSIFTFNSDGTNLVRLTTAGNVLDGDPVWSSDMTKITFTRFYPSQNMKNELWIMNSNGCNQHYTGIEGKFGRWSNNGTKLIYCSKKTNLIYDLYTCDTNGTNEQRLTYSPVDIYMPVYSPDGTEVIYCAGSNNMSDWEIYKMKSDGTGIRKLTNNNFSDAHPKWSPDGTMLAFISDRHQSGKFEVYIMDTSGVNVQRVTYSPENITAVSPNWRKPGTTGVIKINSTVPDNHKLNQNYPNPFNSMTKVKWQMSDAGNAKITVFNVLGREVAILVNEKLKPGTYEITFDAGNLASGVYFYKLFTGEFSETKRMVLLE